MTNVRLRVIADSCKNCRFWATVDSCFTDVAECRRMPPIRSEGFVIGRLTSRPEASLKERGRGIWPLVKEDETCGEFSAIDRC